MGFNSAFKGLKDRVWQVCPTTWIKMLPCHKKILWWNYYGVSGDIGEVEWTIPETGIMWQFRYHLCLD